MIWLVAGADTGSAMFWQPPGGYDGTSIHAAINRPPFLVSGSELMLATRDKTPIKKQTKIVPLLELRPDEFTHEGYWQAMRQLSPTLTRSEFYFSEAFLAFFLQKWATEFQIQAPPAAWLVQSYALGFNE